MVDREKTLWFGLCLPGLSAGLFPFNLDREKEGPPIKSSANPTFPLERKNSVVGTGTARVSTVRGPKEDVPGFERLSNRF